MFQGLNIYLLNTATKQNYVIGLLLGFSDAIDRPNLSYEINVTKLRILQYQYVFILIQFPTSF